MIESVSVANFIRKERKKRRNKLERKKREEKRAEKQAYSQLAQIELLIGGVPAVEIIF